MVFVSDLTRVKKPEDPKDRHIVLYNNKEVEGFDDGIIDMQFEDTPGEIQKQFETIEKHYPSGFSDNFLQYSVNDLVEKKDVIKSSGYTLDNFLTKRRDKSHKIDVDDLRGEQSAVEKTTDVDGSEATYFKLNKLDSDSKYSKEDAKMINWKRKAEKVDPAKYLSEGQKGDIKINPAQDAFKANVSQPTDKSPQDLLDHSTVISKNESQMNHKSALVNSIDKKIAELNKTKDEAIKLEAAGASSKSVNPGDKQFRADGHKEKLNHNPGQAKVDTGKQSGMSDADASKSLSKGTVEKLEYPTSIKNIVKDIPQVVKTEKADGFKDKGEKEKIIPNKNFHSDSDVHQSTDKTLGKKYYTGEEKAKPFQKQFSATGINWSRKAEDMPPQNVDLPTDMMWSMDPMSKKWKVTKKANLEVIAEPGMKEMPKLELPKLDLPKPMGDKPMDKKEDKNDMSKEMPKEEKPKKDMGKKEMDKDEEYLAGECLKEDLEEIMGMYKSNDEVKALLKEVPDLVKHINKLADVAIKLQKSEMEKTSSMLVEASKLFETWSDRRVRKHWASVGGNVGTPSERLERAIASLKDNVANPEAYASALFQKVYNNAPDATSTQK